MRHERPKREHQGALPRFQRCLFWFFSHYLFLCTFDAIIYFCPFCLIHSADGKRASCHSRMIIYLSITHRSCDEQERRQGKGGGRDREEPWKKGKEGWIGKRQEELPFLHGKQRTLLMIYASTTAQHNYGHHITHILPSPPPYYYFSYFIIIPRTFTTLHSMELAFRS